SRVMARHSALRSVCVWRDLDEPIQVVKRRMEVPLEEYDWRALPEEVRKQREKELLEEDRRRSFALSGEPLFRLILIDGSEGWRELILTNHHILLDGWSTVLLLKEVAADYRLLAGGERVELPEAPRYREYIGWIQQQEPKAAETYWRQRLGRV